MSVEIPLYKAGGIVCAYALVDEVDAEWISGYRWHLSGDGYARRSIYVGSSRANHTSRGSSMHREILGLNKGDPRHTDHINRDRLDNRRENLRIVTQAQNNQNIDRKTTSRSGHRGVYWHAFSGLWRVKVVLDGKEISGGYFREIDDAAVAARALIRKHLPFAVIEEAA